MIQVNLNDHVSVLRLTVPVSGTTLVLLATDGFVKFTAATGAVMDIFTGLLRVTPAQFARLPSLNFHINGVSLLNFIFESHN